MRSIPEKTLEHWTSIYLCNRFPNAALWWPASGEDVLIELPRLAVSGAGTTLALELKTTEADDGNHVLKIDTCQLKKYLCPPSGPPLPVYYVFPIPHWTEELKALPGLKRAAPPGGDCTADVVATAGGVGVVWRLDLRDVCTVPCVCTTA